MKKLSAEPSPPAGKSARLLTVRGSLAYGLLLGATALLGYGYLRALPEIVERDRTGACLSLQPVRLGRPALPFELPDETGKLRSLDSLHGKVVLLNFWATWCPPCVEEMPSMEQLARRLAGKDFALVAVSVDDSWELIRDFFARRPTKSALMVLRDASRQIPHRYGTEKFPESYLIDRDGNIRYQFIDKRDWSSESAVQCIESLL